MTIKALDGFKERIKNILDESDCPGLSIAVVKEGEVVFAEGFGLRNVEEGLPATVDTLYAIGSCSKAFTSMTAALMVDEGLLEWDKPVVHYLPDFRTSDPVLTERLTPRDLLTHRSGIGRHEMAWYGSPLSREALVERIRYLEPNLDLRQEFQYNNLTYMLAGYLAGKVAGKTWEELVSKCVFEPLEMRRSNFSVKESQKDENYALPYQEIDGEVKRIPFRNIDAVGPAGSINSSVLEMANWLKMHLAGGKFGEQQLLSDAVFKEMHAPQIVAPGTITEIVGDKAFNWLYAMGWWTVTYRGHELWLHEGGIDGFTAFTYLFPRLGAGVVALSNLNTNYAGGAVVLEALDRLAGLAFVDWKETIHAFMEKIKAASEEGKQKAEQAMVKDAPPTHALADYTGTYEHPGYGTFLVSLKEGSLMLHFLQEDMALEHLQYDIFEFHIPSIDATFRVQYGMDYKGNIDRVSVPFQAGAADIVFIRAADEKMREKAFLEQFAGEYELMGMKLAISVKGDLLSASLPGQPDLTLKPYQGTTFKAKGMPISVRFEQEEDGRVTAAVIDQAGTILTAKRV
jgi:CubicO group peptidase (beta-lactamase class C family)